MNSGLSMTLTSVSLPSVNHVFNRTDTLKRLTPRPRGWPDRRLCLKNLNDWTRTALSFSVTLIYELG